VTGYVLAIRRTTYLKELSGLLRRSPAMSILFLILALGLAGLPPFSGFFAKFALVQAGLAAEHYLIVAVSLAVSMLTLFSMTKIWNEAFWKGCEEVDIASRQPDARLSRSQYALRLAPTLLLAAIVVFMGVGAEIVFTLTDEAARNLVDPSGYIHAVLGVRP
jgi:multicomponent Na+:H+ antiporter subunit D